jgi:phosphoribosyl-AMP cyclohydrolase
MKTLCFSEHAAIKLLSKVDFAKSPLLPAIAMQYDTGEVLMQAWVNQEALHETLTTGRVCYYSRSKQTLWRKGESSGHVQYLQAIRLDCDNDCLLLLVQQEGAACHTYRRNCFFQEATMDGTWKIIADPITSQ